MSLQAPASAVKAGLLILSVVLHSVMSGTEIGCLSCSGVVRDVLRGKADRASR